MSAPDTLSTAAQSLLSMSEQEYLFLFVKLAGIALGLVFAAGTLMGILYGMGLFLWRLMLRSLKEDLAATFCTPAQLEIAISEVRHRFSEGDERMERIECEARKTREEVKLTRESVEQLNRRFLRIFSLLVTHGDSLSKNPPLQAAMESDDSDFFPSSPGAVSRAG